MSERLSDAEIEELKRLEKAATPGPWKSIASQIEKGFRCVQFSAKRDELYNTSALLPADAALIAAARNALPRLLAERAEMREALQAVLMFHKGGPWTIADGDVWGRIVGSDDVTTKAMCDRIRALLGAKETKT